MWNLESKKSWTVAAGPKGYRCQRASVCHSLLLVFVSLQEVNSTPVRFIADLLVEDSWSHVLMDTLAPRGFIKVRAEAGIGKWYCEEICG